MALRTKPEPVCWQVQIPAGKHTLQGTLNIPSGSSSVVVFAHGSGSGRFSSRNQFVARSLQDEGISTLLIDLLNEDETEDRNLIFVIGLLADRLHAAADWLRLDSETCRFSIGYFGAGSTGAAAALMAAALHPQSIGAVVSRGGRADLAADDLADVQAPTLLIVGDNDDEVLALNQQALALMRCPKDLVVIPGPTHLFREPGALEQVARLAADWFTRYLPLRGDNDVP